MRFERSVPAVVAFLAFAEAASAAAPSLVDEGDRFVVANGTLEVAVHKRPFGVRVREVGGATLLESLEGGQGLHAPLSFAIGLNDARSFQGYRQEADLELLRFAVKDVRHAALDGDAAVFECSTTDAIGGRVLRVELSFPEDEIVKLRASLGGGLGDAGVYRFAAAFRAPADERYFGMGKPNDRTEHRGRRLDTWLREGAIGAGQFRPALDAWKSVPEHETLADVIGEVPYLGDVIAPSLDENPTFFGPGNPSHWTTPFFVSNRGYGLLLAMSEPATFDFAARRADALVIDALADRVELVLFHGPEPMEVVKRHARWAGLQPLPPAWAFAPWMSRDEYESAERLRRDFLGMRSRDIPCSVFVLDSPWDVHYHDYELNPAQFPDPRGLIDALHDHGYKLLLWHTSFMNPTSVNHAEALARGYYVKDALGLPYVIHWWKSAPLSPADGLYGHLVDLTNPDAVAWWKTLLQKVIDLGIDGFKNDGGEYVPQDAVLHGGRRGLEMHNQYPTFYDRAVWEALAANREEFIVNPRAGYEGTQRYANVMWAGDQSSDWDPGDGFPTVVIGGIALGMSGVPFYGHDVGGYTDDTSGPLTRELFIRWAQFGALSPIMQIHSKRNVTPWSFGEHGAELYRIFAKLHTQLVPYVYTMAVRAASTGEPIIRHPFLVSPGDPATAADSFSYFYGDHLFVAPFTEPGGSRSIHFPAGANYVDWFTGEVFAGGSDVASYSRGLDRMPLFAVEGSIVPLFHPAIDTLAPGTVEGIDYGTLDSDVVARVFPKDGASSEFVLFDGSVLGARTAGGTVEITIAATTPRRWFFEVPDGHAVTIDGRAASRSPEGWWY